MSGDILALGGIAGAVVVIVAAIRLLGPVKRKVRAFFVRMERANDVVLGSPAIPDPDRPGQVLRPEIPDIGVRMTRTESLLQEFVVGAVEEAKHAAKAAAESATAAQGAAEAARGYAAASAGRFTELGEQVEGLATQVTEWQNRDRYRAEAAQDVLRGVVGSIPEPTRKRVGG